jgi:hypothetical protein
MAGTSRAGSSIDARCLELLPDSPEMLERRFKPPLPHGVPRRLHLLRGAAASAGGGRLDLRSPEFALREPALLHRGDDWIDEIASGWTR